MLSFHIKKPSFFNNSKLQIIDLKILYKADSEIKLVQNIQVKPFFIYSFINTEQQISFHFLLNSFLYTQMYGIFYS